MRYSIKKIGKHAIYKQKDPSWVVPSAYFSLSFTTNVDEVLDYGSNGLHYLEHILYNVINAKCDFFSGNASTYDDGTMNLYFITEEEHLESNITNFFDAFESVFDPSNYSKFSRFYRIEQRRVASEVAMMDDEGKTALMFASNPEIYRGEYPVDFIWSILFRRCTFEKLVLITHCNFPTRLERMFTRRMNAIQTLWDNRASIPLDDPGIIFTTTFPPSHIAEEEMSIDDIIGIPEIRDISLREIDNPIVRLIIVASLRKDNTVLTTSPFLYSLQVRLTFTPTRMHIYDIDPDPSDSQYYWAPIFLSAGEGITAEEVNEIVNTSSKTLLRKYRAASKRYIRRL